MTTERVAEDFASYTKALQAWFDSCLPQVLAAESALQELGLTPSPVATAEWARASASLILSIGTRPKGRALRASPLVALDGQTLTIGFSVCTVGLALARSVQWSIDTVARSRSDIGVEILTGTRGDGSAPSPSDVEWVAKSRKNLFDTGFEAALVWLEGGRVPRTALTGNRLPPIALAGVGE